MTIAGQADTTYAYNDADQLTGVTRGAETATIGYDSAGRRGSLTLPAGISQTYGYDDASRLTSITYQRGTSLLGSIARSTSWAARSTRTARMAGSRCPPSTIPSPTTRPTDTSNCPRLTGHRGTPWSRGMSALRS
jgi:YD repeat-containing protein